MFDQFSAMFTVGLDVGAVSLVHSGSTHPHFFSQKQIFVMINRKKKSGFISFLSVISYIKLWQSKKNASLRQRYETQPVIHKGWKSNEV